MTTEYIMRATLIVSPFGYVYWASVGSPDYGGTQSGYTPSTLTNIVVDYSVNIPVGGPGVYVPTDVAGGDLANTYPDPVVASLQGVTISGTPTAGYVLQALSSLTAAWQPQTGSSASGIFGPASGDLTGTYPGPSVARLQGYPLATSVPSTSQSLQFNGTEWIATTNTYFSVKSFGAKGDNSTDDTLAIRLAIAAVQSQSPNGGTLYFPAGTYLTHTIVLPAFVSLKGEGFNSSVIQQLPPPSTTIASGSNTAILPQSTINVVSTAGFVVLPGGFSGSGAYGYLFVTSSNGVQTITFTGISGNSFTGCSGGTGTLTTGNAVVSHYTDVVNMPGAVNSGASSDLVIEDIAFISATDGVATWSPTGSSSVYSVGQYIVPQSPASILLKCVAANGTTGTNPYVPIGQLTAGNGGGALLSGTPTGRMQVDVQVVTGGYLGTMQFKIYQGTGTSFGPTQNTTAGNVYNYQLPSSPVSVVFGPGPYTASNSTTVAAGSSGALLPQSIIHAASVAGFPASGEIFVISNAGGQLLNYTSVLGSPTSTFNGCTGAYSGGVTGTLSTGNAIVSNFVAPSPKVVVSGTPNANYTVDVATSGGPLGVMEFQVATNADQHKFGLGTFGGLQTTTPGSSFSYSVPGTGLTLTFYAGEYTASTGGANYFTPSFGWSMFPGTQIVDGGYTWQVMPGTSCLSNIGYFNTVFRRVSCTGGNANIVMDQCEDASIEGCYLSGNTMCCVWVCSGGDHSFEGGAGFTNAVGMKGNNSLYSVNGYGLIYDGGSAFTIDGPINFEEDGGGWAYIAGAEGMSITGIYVESPSTAGLPGGLVRNTEFNSRNSEAIGFEGLNFSGNYMAIGNTCALDVWVGSGLSVFGNHFGGNVTTAAFIFEAGAGAQSWVEGGNVVDSGNPVFQGIGGSSVSFSNNTYAQFGHAGIEFQYGTAGPIEIFQQTTSNSSFVPQAMIIQAQGGTFAGATGGALTLSSGNGPAGNGPLNLQVGATGVMEFTSTTLTVNVPQQKNNSNAVTTEYQNVASVSTSNATGTNIFTWTIPTDTMTQMDATVIGSVATGSHVVGGVSWKIAAAIVNNNGIITLGSIHTNQNDVVGPAGIATGAAVNLVSTGTLGQIQVVGTTGTSIQWGAICQRIEVT